MEKLIIIHTCFWILVLPMLLAPVVADYKHYVVYLGAHNGGARLQDDDAENVTRSHHHMISSLSKRNGNDRDPSKRIVYSYTKTFNAFAALLHEEEANELANHPDVISIFKDRKMISYTTHSWDFLSSFLHQAHIRASKKILKKAKQGEDIIIANVDTGVWPESESFKDEGFGPIPKKFKGQCDNAKDPTTKCNRKLIGARYFNKGYVEGAKAINVTLSLNPSFRDLFGHGTHTLSTAGGNIVTQVQEKALNLKMLGMKNATARGGAPRARVVAYKTLWPEAGNEVLAFIGQGSAVDTLAGIEAAINDGVDIINLSIGTSDPPQDPEIRRSYYLQETNILGSFHAMANGISVVAASGNSGPIPGSLGNFAPWQLTVGATTFGRAFICYISLANNQKIKASRFLDDASVMNETTFYPLITGAEAHVNGANSTNASYCIDGSVDPVKVKGKILVCVTEANYTSPAYHKSKVAREAGAVGVIMANDKVAGLNLMPDDMHFIPTAHITYNDAQTLFSYINSTRDPSASFTSTIVETGVTPAPVVASFSSRGPNLLAPEILKPDVIAPGVTVFSAYSEAKEAIPLSQAYVFSSGTSMSTPHVSGIVALLKKMHRSWSPAAIKSAIMTTASPLDNRGKPILEEDLVQEASPFAIGAGLVQPELAMHPGLVYDMNQFDYLNFLCAIHYNKTVIKEFTRQHNYDCPKSFNLKDLNYPSITVYDLSGTVSVTRRLKNVGHPSTYTARVEPPPGISIVVEPKTLVFAKKNQEIIYKLFFSVTDINHPPSNDYIFGSLEWSDGKHVVRSPIVVKVKDLNYKNTSQL